MRTIEQICEDLTGINAMNFVKSTDDEFVVFFKENNVEWILELLKKYNGKWEAIPAPKDVVEAFLGGVDVDMGELENSFYTREHNGTLILFEDGKSVKYSQSTRYGGYKKCIVLDTINEPDDGDFEDWYNGEFYK